jgi:hypothetical protein
MLSANRSANDGQRGESGVSALEHDLDEVLKVLEGEHKATQ